MGAEGGSFEVRKAAGAALTPRAAQGDHQTQTPRFIRISRSYAKGRQGEPRGAKGSQGAPRAPGQEIRLLRRHTPAAASYAGCAPAHASCVPHTCAACAPAPRAYLLNGVLEGPRSPPAPQRASCSLAARQLRYSCTSLQQLHPPRRDMPRACTCHVPSSIPLRASPACLAACSCASRPRAYITPRVTCHAQPPRQAAPCTPQRPSAPRGPTQ